MSFGILQKNGCAHTNGSTHNLCITISEKKPLEELKVVMTGTEIFGCFAEEELEKAGISVSVVPDLTLITAVVPDPEFIRMDLDGMIASLSNKFDDETADENNNPVSYIILWKRLIHSIKDFVKDGDITPAELVEKLNKADEEDIVSFEVLDDSIQTIIDDMITVGFLTLEDGKIKASE